MKTRNWSDATVVLGFLAAVFAACAAQTEGGLPDLTGGAPSSAGGSGPLPSAGSGGSFSAASGAPPAFGGAPGASGSFSAAGAPPSSGGSPPQGVAGAPAGAAGAPAIGGCTPAVGTATDLLIDDLEDGDNAIQMLGQRSGYWYTYNDKSGTQTPLPSAAFMPTAGGHSPKFSAHTSGTAFTVFGAGVGLDFNNRAATPCVYNGAAYAGITFWAKGTVAIKAMVKIPATTAVVSGGTCAAMCEDHYFIKGMLSAAWTQYTIDFATITQEGWGATAPFDKTKLLGLQFQVGVGMAFDFAIDDITFY